jgi:hypothetical protein
MGFEDEAEQSFTRPYRQTEGRSKQTYELTSSIVPRGTSFHRSVELEFPPIAFDPAPLSCCCSFLPGPAELGAVNPDAVHDHGQPTRQRRNPDNNRDPIGERCTGREIKVTRTDTPLLSSRLIRIFKAPRKNQHCLECCDAHSASELGHKLPRDLIRGAAALPPKADTNAAGRRVR